MALGIMLVANQQFKAKLLEGSGNLNFKRWEVSSSSPNTDSCLCLSRGTINNTKLSEPSRRYVAGVSCERKPS